MNIVYARDTALEDLLNGYTLDAVDFSSILPNWLSGNYVIGLDIENIVTGAGNTTVKFIGDASIQGTLTKGAGALTLDYSEFSGVASTDPDAGVDLKVLPEITLIPEFNVGPVTVNELAFPGIGFSLGAASGVEGNRLMGLTQWADFLENWDGNWGLGNDFLNLNIASLAAADIAVTGFSSVIGSTGNDNLKGNDDNNAFDLSAGGVDNVDGGDQKKDGFDSVKFADSEQVIVDLQGATAYTGDYTSLLAPAQLTRNSNDSSNQIQTLSTNANVGVFSLSYNGVKTTPLAFNSSAKQIEDALNALANLSGVSVSGQGSGNDPWEIILGSTGNFDALTYNTNNITLVTVDASNSIQFGLYQLDTSALTTRATINNIEAIQGGSQNDLFFGASGDNRYQFSKGWGQDIIIEQSSSGEDLLEFVDFSTAEKDALKDLKLGGIHVYWMDNGTSIDYVIALNTEGEVPDDKKATFNLGSNWAKSGIGTGIQLLKNTIGPLQAETAGIKTGLVALDSTLANAAFTEAKTLWTAAGLTGNLANFTLAFSDLPDNELANFDATNNIINLDITAAGHGWYTNASGTPDADKIDLLTVLVHEMGHAGGLEHSASDISVMNSTLATGERSIDISSLLANAVKSDADKLLDGLGALDQWSNNLGTNLDKELSKIGLPFIGDAFSTLGLDQLANNAVGDSVAVLKNSLNDYLSSTTTPDIDDLLNYFNNDTNLSNFKISRSDSSIQSYAVIIEVIGFDENIDINLDDWSLDSLPIDLPFSVQSGTPLNINGGVFFNFDFGLDENGNFYSADPGLELSLSIGDDLHVLTLNGSALEVSGDVRSVLAAGDAIQVVDDEGNLLYTTINGTPTYNAVTNITSLSIAALPVGLSDGETLALRKTLDMNVSMGIIGLEVDNGYFDFDAGLGLSYEGRLGMAALNGDDGSLAGTPKLDTVFEYDIQLPVKASGALSSVMDGLGLITASSANLAGDLSLTQLIGSIPKTIEMQGLGDLFQINGISLDMLLDALQAILTELENGGLDEDIPLLGVSANDVLGDGTTDFVSELNAAITTARNADTLDQVTDIINDQMEAFLGLDATADPFKLTYMDSTLMADFGLEWLLTEQYPLDFDLATLDPTGIMKDLGLVADGQADLALTGLAAVNFGIGLDVSDISAPLAYVTDDTGIDLRFAASAEDIAMKLGFNVDQLTGIDLDIGVQIEEGLASLDLFLEVGLDDVDDGRYAIADVADTFFVDAGGEALIDLPLYFPIRSMPLGGSTDDLDGDGTADNSLYLDMGVFYSNTDGFSYTSPNTSMPDLSFDFNLFNLLADQINDPNNVLIAMENLFDQIDKMADGIDSVELPLIGGAPFDSLASELRDLRTSILGDKSTGSYTSGMGKALLDGVVAGDTVLDLVREELYQGLKEINDPLFSFLVPNSDDYGALQYLGNGQLDTKPVSSADDIQLSLTDEGELTFNLIFGGVLVDEALAIDFSVGVPGFSLGAEDAELYTNISYLMGLGFGFDSQGVFLDTSGITESGEEISLDVFAGLVKGSTFIGQLGFLQMEIADLGNNGSFDGIDYGSGIKGHLGVDLSAGGDGRWTVGETLGIEALASLSAAAELYTEVDTSLGDVLPEISTTIIYNQVLANASLSSSGSSISFGLPEIELKDVTLDLGNVVNGILKPIVDTIGAIVDPLAPLIELLTMEIDLGVDKFQLIDLAYLRLPFKVVDIAKKVLNILGETIDFVKMVRSMSVDGGINFGDFVLSKNVLENEGKDGKVTKSETSGNTLTNTSKDKAALNDLTRGPDQKGLKDKKGEKSFRIPVLEDPASVMNLLLGKGEVDLFWYDLPDLELDFSYSKSVPIFTGMNAIFGGAIGAYTNFDFGFDTRGISQWAENDFSLDKSWQVFNGFYLDDHGLENTPDDKPEAVIYAEVTAGLSLGLAGLVEAGIQAGINATIEFDLNDKLTDINLAGELVGDGKLYGDEIIDRLSHEWYCLFDTRGQLSVFVEAFLWVGLDLGFSEITIFEARERFVDEVIAEFEFECVTQRVDDIAQQSGDSLTLKYIGGENASDAHNYKVESIDINADLTTASLLRLGYFDADTYTSSELSALNTQLQTYRNSYAGEKAIIVSIGTRVEIFRANDIKTIYTAGTAKDDSYIFNGLDGLVDILDVNTQSGVDYVRVNSGGVSSNAMTVKVNTGSGKDRLDSTHKCNTIWLYL